MIASEATTAAAATVTAYGRNLSWRQFDQLRKALAKARPTSSKPCRLCHRIRCPNGHDPCIANLPGLINACCGHGVACGYAIFEDREMITFQTNGSMTMLATSGTMEDSVNELISLLRD